jgi:hypothetical protein
MAYKFKERDYHLTESGWSTSDVPTGSRVESWRLSVYQESSWSKEQRSWSRIWHSLAWSDAERDRLRRVFPPPVATDPVGQPSSASAVPNEHWPQVRRAAR